MSLGERNPVRRTQNKEIGYNIAAGTEQQNYPPLSFESGLIPV
jgi:hypothetical protein